MANPLTPVSQSTLATSGESRPPLPASPACLPLIPMQDDFLKLSRNTTTPQLEKVSEEVARYLGIPFSSGLDEPVEETGWIGGTMGLMQIFLRKSIHKTN